MKSPRAALLCALLVAARVAAAARVEYDWTISKIDVKMDGVRERGAVAVNGKVPMPLARASLGDTLVLRLRNNLDERTGLHSHGIFNNGTNYYDGAGGITECGVAPGSQMEYEIPVVQTGTYWLHGHHNSQYINGLRGPLVITDPSGEPYDYDEDIVLTLEDWYPHYSNKTMGSGGHMEGMGHVRSYQGCSHTDYQSAGGAGTPECHDNSTAPFDPAEKYPVGVINGVYGESAPELNFEPGKTYRIRVLNIGSTAMFRFAVGGHEMYVIEADGVATEMKKVSSVVVAVAQRVSVLVRALPTADVNHKYHFELFTDVFPQFPGFNPRAYEGTVVYDADSNAVAPSTLVAEEFDDLSLVPLDRKPLLENPDVVHEVVITADRGDSGIVKAYVNGVSFMMPERPSLLTAMAYQGRELINATAFGRNTNALVVRHMDVVELRVVNRDSVAHPMHMHGYFFQIVERGTLDSPGSAVRSTRTPMHRDTTIVGPGTYAVLRIRADSPGVWLMHCHIELHMELGLAMLLITGPEKIAKTMALPPAMREQCRLLGIPV
ncbi:ferroxidase fet3 [Coemansia javaensis]|uniref:Ferroxidase fet3 n=1 Tax=Coemansia javaensis TaxID=2761396 RepID=A0A9W8H1J9_9FUNG|nr:ferroxidase fet3 [Coemansia javaensis]